MSGLQWTKTKRMLRYHFICTFGIHVHDTSPRLVTSDKSCKKQIPALRVVEDRWECDQLTRWLCYFGQWSILNPVWWLPRHGFQQLTCSNFYFHMSGNEPPFSRKLGVDRSHEDRPADNWRCSVVTQPRLSPWLIITVIINCKLRYSLTRFSKYDVVLRRIKTCTNMYVFGPKAS